MNSNLFLVCAAALALTASAETVKVLFPAGGQRNFEKNTKIAVSTTAAFLLLRWVPKGGFSMESARRLGGFGIKMLAASATQNLYLSLRPLIIGKRFSAADLGYYDKGRNFSYTISVNLDAAIRSVMFPVLSRAQDDREQFRVIMRRMSMLGSFVIFPVMLGLAAVAEPLIRLLLTDKWLAAARISRGSSPRSAISCCSRWQCSSGHCSKSRSCSIPTVSQKSASSP